MITLLLLSIIFLLVTVIMWQHRAYRELEASYRGMWAWNRFLQEQNHDMIRATWIRINPTEPEQVTFSPN